MKMGVIPNDKADKPLPRRLPGLKQPQQPKHLALAPRIDRHLPLLVHLCQQHAKVPSASALPRAQQRLCDAVKHVHRGIPLLRLDVPRHHDSGLLLRLVVLPLRDLFPETGDGLLDVCAHRGEICFCVSGSEVGGEERGGEGAAIARLLEELGAAR